MINDTSFLIVCRLQNEYILGVNLVQTLKIGTLKIENGSQHIGVGHDSSLFNENREPEN